ncbi:MAG: M15 family metallopeptidase [Prevotellaceae bacterium]|nr:M15 family metallopeptidase [Prevotellaceae bacterium]
MDSHLNNKRLLLFLAIALSICLHASSQGKSQFFSISPINNEIEKRITGKSYKQNCPIDLEDLRYLQVLYYDFNGNTAKGELICNKAIAQDLIDIFHELYKAKYPIECIRLIDEYDADDQRSMADNNTSCFNYRTISGSNTISKHGKGMAIDINPLYNPYVTTRKGKTHVEPIEGKPYTDRNKNFKHKIDKTDLCYRLFIKHGFRWGGSWRYSKDYQHFEK